MSSKKKQVRETFRTAVFKRDKNKCRVCDAVGALDAHHITDRNEMPNGGYVPENGISLCEKCHVKAEKFHISGGEEWELNFHPADLYKLIGSNYQRAVDKSNKL